LVKVDGINTKVLERKATQKVNIALKSDKKVKVTNAIKAKKKLRNAEITNIVTESASQEVTENYLQETFDGNSESKP